MEAVTFSDLQLRGRATVEGWLRRSQSRVLRIQRRDAEDLVLTTATPATVAAPTPTARSQRDGLGAGTACLKSDASTSTDRTTATKSSAGTSPNRCPM